MVQLEDLIFQIHQSTSLNKIKEYDFDAIVYPGHGPATSLKQEQASNPYL